jgi:tetratricopeptide (TPR) repeat protein
MVDAERARGEDSQTGATFEHGRTATGEVVSAAPGAPLPRGASVGRYVVLDGVGAGAMGVVYAAYDPELDRKVALKLLKSARSDGVGRLRLLREAQALAKLSHPNVVAVHDVGTSGEQVFIAMEFVAGVTLAQRLTERAHAWPELLALFIAIGRGLAAAHRAGLVHRDFKPDNVMICADERPRVMDFGLARVEPAPAPDMQGDTLVQPREPALELEVTAAGAVLGTPQYMAPEQWAGGSVDARTDQFAFCVALWAALFGARPFVGATPAALRLAVMQGSIVEPARAGHGASRTEARRVAAVLRRGLAADPSRRHADMDTLLAALGERRRSWRRVAALVGVGLTLAGLGGAAWRPAPVATPTPCEGLEARLDGVWDGARRAAVEQAFAATGKSHALAAAADVVVGLDRWATAWSEQARAACVATRIQGTRSELLLDRQMACMDRRLDEVRGLVAALVRADAGVVADAARAVERLSPLAGCADSEALLAEVAPPSPTQAIAVAALRVRLDRTRPLLELHAAEAAQALAPLLVEADAIGYAPLRAEVGRALARGRRKQGEFAEEERLLFAALAAAEAGSDARQASTIRAKLVSAMMSLSRLDEALVLLRVVEPEFARPGREAERADLQNERGRLLVARGELAAGRAALEQALAWQEQLHGPDALPVAAGLDHLSYVALLGGQQALAQAYAQRAIDILEARLGPAHPRLLSPLTALGDALLGASRFDEAMAVYERALALAIAAYGPRHGEVGHCQWSMGDIEAHRNNFAAATRHYEQALAITEGVVGADHPDTAECLYRVAVSRAWAGHVDEAAQLLARSVDIHTRHSGPDSYLTLRGRSERAMMLTAGGHHAEALAEIAAVVAATERTQGESDELLNALMKQGESLLAAKQPTQAIAPLERALALADARPSYAERRARIALQLATALWSDRGARRRARELATQARDAWAGLGGSFAVDRASAEQWLAAHR